MKPPITSVLSAGVTADSSVASTSNRPTALVPFMLTLIVARSGASSSVPDGADIVPLKEDIWSATRLIRPPVAPFSDTVAPSTSPTWIAPPGLATSKKRLLPLCAPNDVRFDWSTTITSPFVADDAAVSVIALAGLASENAPTELPPTCVTVSGPPGSVIGPFARRLSPKALFVRSTGPSIVTPLAEAATSVPPAGAW